MQISGDTKLDMLKDWRNKIRGKKFAYFILKDETLEAIAAKNPQTKEELVKITGIGEHKLKMYGSAILQIMRG